MSDVSKLAKLVAEVGQPQAKVARLEKCAGDAGGATYVPPDWTSEDAADQAGWFAELRSWVDAGAGSGVWAAAVAAAMLGGSPPLLVGTVGPAGGVVNAYKRNRTDLEAAVTFTDRLLPGVQTRLTEYLSPCGGARGCVARVRSVS